MSESASFEIVAGTYEEYLIGYIFSPQKKSLVQSFASHDHSASVRCLATNGNYLASGASDDRIVIYDLKARKEHCMLTHHNSTITAIQFTNDCSHVISASQDGNLSIVRVGNWQLEKLWEKAHKEGNILDIALHSSGKLALTLGSDGTIHTWNLVKGRKAYIINLKTKCRDYKTLDKILFVPDDGRFAIFGGKYTEIWSIKVGGALKVIEHEQKVTCCAWAGNEKLFVGYEDGNVALVDVESETKTVQRAHTGRVKVARWHENFLVTASSLGEIKIWTEKLQELCAVNTGCRITCMCITNWMGTLKTEKSDDETSREEVPKQKRLKSTVVVEVEASTDEETEKASLTKQKSKRRKKIKDDEAGKKKKLLKKGTDQEVSDHKAAKKLKKKTKKLKTHSL